MSGLASLKILVYIGSVDRKRSKYMDTTLEKELTTRIFLHKVTIIKSALMNTYIAGELKKGYTMIPRTCLERGAMNYADKLMSDIMEEGRLEEAYEKAWNLIGTRMPDNYRITQEDLQF